MKKFIAVLLCAVTVCTAFAACSKSGKDADKTTVVKEEKTTAITTDTAKITESDAINLIESYSDKELGLTEDEREECSFMVAGNGVEIDKAYYVNVIAAVKTEHKDKKTGEITYTFENKGDYYISYDGKKILSKDVESGKYSEMKVKPVPTTEAVTDHTHAEEETKK